LGAFTSRELNFDEFKTGGLHEKQAEATWKMGTTSTFSWKQRKAKATCGEMTGRRTFRMHTDI
jgi:hypothetical protein